MRGQEKAGEGREKDHLPGGEGVRSPGTGNLIG